MNIISFILFFPSVIYDFTIAVLTKQKWYSRIDDLVILGALPLETVASKLINEENVRAVISLNESYELWFAYGAKKWLKHNIQFLHLPTADIFEAPCQKNLKTSLEFIKNFIDLIDLSDTRKDHPSVYIHCKGGKSRSATVVVCYLIYRYGWSPEEAVRHVQSKRPQVLLWRKHWRVIEDFYLSLNGN